jgi:methylamine dehydrogenase light chain
MLKLDHLFERSTRSLAQRTSRRSVLASLGQLLTGAAVLPLLPIQRGGSARASEAKPRADSPEDCQYWKYCALDGFLCSCCGGTSSSCPPGTAQSPISWIGTCHNPADGRDYVMSYNDCCGKSSCGACVCSRNEGEKPIYRPSRNNDLNWCLANADANYHCTVSVIVGVAEK